MPGRALAVALGTMDTLTIDLVPYSKESVGKFTPCGTRNWGKFTSNV
jgi:hypothetical protein